MLILRQDIGPISDEEFFELVDNGVISDNSDVRSPELTGDEWFPLYEVRIDYAREILQQRKAELRRLNAIREHQKQIRAENQSRIRSLIRAAISDGTITENEKTQITAFAERTRLKPDEVSEILRTESQQLVDQMIDESLDDGILEPAEERHIVKCAKRLGLALILDSARKRKVELSRFAWQLNHTTANDLPEIPVESVIGKKERCIAKAEFEWNEIANLTRPKGISLGDDQYLITRGEGECHLTEKQLVLVGPFKSKKARLSSIEQVTKYSDGVFLNRSSGKSVFLRFVDDSIESRQFAITLDWLVSGIVQATFADHCFVPEPERSSEDEEEPFSALEYGEPRFTFRVVGDHIGDRRHWISCLSPMDRLMLIREPANPYDSNAVMVFDTQGHMLGYLKRDVAEWYGPRMDSGIQPAAQVHRLRESGALIIGVYE